ncbi:uncharacterized protein LOC135398470 [Ornithodoros turicata]|uniref:uncharacterized protein LOC135398470 n=1 Tax=Ornithodoros turicata TaxID=34597 RepID=UPI003138E1FD
MDICPPRRTPESLINRAKTKETHPGSSTEGTTGRYGQQAISLEHSNEAPTHESPTLPHATQQDLSTDGQSACSTDLSHEGDIVQLTWNAADTLEEGMTTIYACFLVNSDTDKIGT